MAVARIKAPARWHKSVAKIVPDYPGLKRELLRAATRYGLTTELNSDEVRMLAERLPKDPRVATALREVEESEARERLRPRFGNLLAERRGDRA